ncbi:MAG: DUF2087 domain-containing protein [Proteobacteria bacterium]|nr:DUF2087 domain-containing protein [Pseudomonadota bacterium]
MPRTETPLHANDISSFAKTLSHELKLSHERLQRLPGHVELLNMLARAAGHRNFQSLKARPSVSAAPAAAPDAAAPALSDTAARALRQFDAQGRITRWPIRFGVQRLMLWGLWMHFDGKRRYREREVNEILNAWHLFGDHCLLRRELVEMKMLARTDGGAEYRKLPCRPGAEAMALMRVLRARS